MVETEPRNIEKPTSVTELSEVVRAAAALRQGLLIRGGRTHMRFENAGPKTDLVVDMTGLDQAIDYSPVDLTVAVEAGMSLAALDRLLAERGQRLPLDMPHRERATLGGTFAAGLSGPRRLRYGSLKDVVIGAEVVNSRGEVAKSGGMVVKNVSGYELARLHYGAHGAFGIVTRLNLKVLPAVEYRVEARIVYDDVATALDAGAELLVSTFDPAAVYVARSAEGRWTLHAQFEGSRPFTEAQGQRVLDELPDGQTSGIVGVDGPSTPAFDAIADLTDPGVAVARFSVPASRQADILNAVDRLGNVEILADMGSGLVYARGATGASWVDVSRQFAAPTSFLALPDAVRSELDIFGAMDASSLEVIRRLKDQYDPDRIFNPGRFVSLL